MPEVAGTLLGCDFEFQPPLLYFNGVPIRPVHGVALCADAAARKIALLTAAILSIPMFCWQTTHEVLTYAEQINDDVQHASISGLLQNLVRRGYLESKLVPKSPGRGGPMMVNMYRRRENNPPYGRPSKSSES
jgi:hypothetical protein